MNARPRAVSFVSVCFGVLAFICFAVAVLVEPKSFSGVCIYLAGAFAFAAIARGLWQLRQWARIAAIVASAFYTFALLVAQFVIMPQHFRRYGCHSAG